MEPRRCRCHDEPMQPNGKKWQCGVRRRERERCSPLLRAKRRERQLRFYHAKQKHDPVYQLDRALRDLTRIRY